MFLDDDRTCSKSEDESYSIRRHLGPRLLLLTQLCCAECCFGAIYFGSLKADLINEKDLIIEMSKNLLKC